MSGVFAAFTGHPFLAELALSDWLKKNGLSLGDFVRLEGEALEPATLSGHLQPSLFGGGGVIANIAGLRSTKDIFALLLNADVPVCIIDPLGAETRLKQYRERGEVVASPFPKKDFEIQKWLAAHVRAEGIGIDAAGVNYLVEAFGDDVGSILGELNKLSLFEGKKIPLENLQRLVGLDPKGDAFALLEAATAGNAPAALAQLRHLLGRDEGEAFRLLGAVAWQYNTLARLRGILSRHPKVSPQEAAGLLGLNPFVVKKNLPLARRLSEADLRRAFVAIAEADYALKDSHEPMHVFQLLTLKLSTSERR